MGLLLRLRYTDPEGGEDEWVYIPTDDCIVRVEGGTTTIKRRTAWKYRDEQQGFPVGIYMSMTWLWRERPMAVVKATPCSSPDEADEIKAREGP